MTKEFKTLAFVGAGNMTRSIIAGLVKNGYPSDAIFASNPSSEKLTALNQEFSINVTQSNSDCVKHADVVVLSVKPQFMGQMLKQLTQHVDLTDKLILSVAAGITVDTLIKQTGASRVVRSIPNTPALLGLGMTGLFASDSVTENDKELVSELMSAIGKFIWVDNESDIDSVTGLAGSAPAYFFLFMEGLQEKAISMGFSKEQSRQLVEQVALGSASMVIKNPNVDIQTLRSQVTSKGGTTAKAIAHFESAGLTQTVAEAVDEAKQRAEEMAQEFRQD